MHPLALARLLHQELKVEDITDYTPNGLQVEGRAEIQNIITGVTASQALLDVAVAERIDALLVHHGYFWRQEPAVVCGMQRRRLKTLLTHDINLFAYHLPLDLHPRFGNNVQLAALFGITVLGAIAGTQPPGIVLQGVLPTPLTGIALAEQIAQHLDRRPLYCGDNAPALVRRVAWCSGAGQGYLQHAAVQGIDAFITGEVSEQTIHIAREMGVHFYAVGHHASERYGVKAFGEWLAAEHGFSVHFVDIANPA